MSPRYSCSNLNSGQYISRACTHPEHAGALFITAQRQVSSSPDICWKTEEGVCFTELWSLSSNNRFDLSDLSLSCHWHLPSVPPTSSNSSTTATTTWVIHWCAAVASVAQKMIYDEYDQVLSGWDHCRQRHLQSRHYRFCQRFIFNVLGEVLEENDLHLVMIRIPFADLLSMWRTAQLAVKTQPHPVTPHVRSQTGFKHSWQFLVRMNPIAPPNSLHSGPFLCCISLCFGWLDSRMSHKT